MADNQYIGLNSVTIESINITAQAIPSISIDNNGLITAESSQTAGYVAEGISTATKQLKIQTAQTIVPGITDKSINSGTYLTGIQTIKGDANLQAANIKEGTSIFGVEGTYKATDVTFTVADGNNAPSNPQNNVIWVQTDTEIPSYAILSSVERPSNPAEGMVWVVNGQTSSGAFDLTVDDNVVAIYPQKAYQYVNGEWTPRPIKVYKDGQWIDLFTATLNITYPAGSICECTDGVITYTAPDTSGIWELIVPNQGTWIVSGIEDDWQGTAEAVVNINGESHIIELIKAFITVTYPKGTCTVSLNGNSFSHSGGGTHTFTVNDKGTWTVKAVYNTITKTSNVSISNSGENKSVSISYDLIAFANGAYKDIGSMSNMSLSGGALSIKATTSINTVVSTWASSNISVNVTDYKTLQVTATWSNGNQRNATYRRGQFGLTKSNFVGSGNSADYTSGFAAVKTFSCAGGSSVSGTFNIDISSLSGSYYITAGTSSWADNLSVYLSTTLTVTDIRLLA